jgi:hypothetical protein
MRSSAQPAPARRLLPDCTNSEQWIGWGKVVDKLRTDRWLNHGFCTGWVGRAAGAVHIPSHFSPGNSPLYHAFSTGQHGLFTPVAAMVLPISHRSYNNKEFLNKLLLLLIGEVI